MVNILVRRSTAVRADVRSRARGVARRRRSVFCPPRVRAPQGVVSKLHERRALIDAVDPGPVLARGADRRVGARTRGARTRSTRDGTRERWVEIRGAGIARRGGRARRRRDAATGRARSDETEGRGRARCGATDEGTIFDANSAFVAPVAATAMAILLAGPAHAGEGGRLGLELKNGTGLAPGKYEQPFYDPRPVVTVQTDGPGDVTKDEARILPNRQIGPGACKLITGAPCVDFQSGK